MGEGEEKVERERRWRGREGGEKVESRKGEAGKEGGGEGGALREKGIL